MSFMDFLFGSGAVSTTAPSPDLMLIKQTNANLSGLVQPVDRHYQHHHRLHNHESFEQRNQQDSEMHLNSAPPTQNKIPQMGNDPGAASSIPHNQRGDLSSNLPLPPSFGKKLPLSSFNHTFLDHVNEMPPEFLQFINDHYNDRFVMTVIQSDQMNGVYVNNTGNETDIFTYEEQMPEWKRILDTVVTWVMTINVVGIMLGMGCAIFWRDVVNNLWPPVGIIIGMCGQFLLLPAAGFAFSILFQLQPYEALGCLVVSCSPGGSFSNFLTFWVEGDLALSIVMTACSSIIAFVGMPFNLWMYSSYYVGEEAEAIVIPYLNIVQALIFICGPVVVGMIIRHFSKTVADKITRIMSLVGYVGFVIVLGSWLALFWEVFIAATPLIYLSAVILPITGFTVAYVVAFLLRRPHKVCRTIGIETGSQNMPVALSIILLSFSDPIVRAKMIIFPTLYGIFMLTEVFLFIGLYRAYMHCRDSKTDSSKEYPMSHRASINGAGVVAGATVAEKEKLNP